MEQVCLQRMHYTQTSRSHETLYSLPLQQEMYISQSGLNTLMTGSYSAAQSILLADDVCSHLWTHQSPFVSRDS